MSTTGSVSSRSFSPALGIAVTLAGVAAMSAGGILLATRSGLGVRTQIALGTLLLAIPALAALLGLRRGAWRETLGLGPLPPRMLGLSILLGGALWILSIGLMELQSLVLPPPPEYLEAFRALHRALAPRGALDGLVSVAVIAIGPGLGEEIVTRGVLLPSLTRALRPWGAVVLSALLFAAMHFDPYRFLFTLTIGLVLGVVRLRTGSLWPPIVAHVSLNALTFLVAPLVDDPEAVYTPEPLIGVACLVIGAGLALPLLRGLGPFVDSSGGAA
jgi:membrane protease YdiL (CAAX protease family)